MREHRDITVGLEIGFDCALPCGMIYGMRTVGWKRLCAVDARHGLVDVIRRYILTLELEDGWRHCLRSLSIALAT